MKSLKLSNVVIHKHAYLSAAKSNITLGRNIVVMYGKNVGSTFMRPDEYRKLLGDRSEQQFLKDIKQHLAVQVAHLEQRLLEAFPELRPIDLYGLAIRNYDIENVDRVYKMYKDTKTMFESKWYFAKLEL